MVGFNLSAKLRLVGCIIPIFNKTYKTLAYFSGNGFGVNGFWKPWRAPMDGENVDSIQQPLMSFNSWEPLVSLNKALLGPAVSSGG